jgi:hypothetical protein
VYIGLGELRANYKLTRISVWDMTYIATGGKIISLNKTLSNGSTAGIASMPGTRFLGTLANVFQDESTGPESRSSPSAFIRSFSLGMSKAYSYPLASQMSGRPSLLAQVRTSKVVTRLPVAALWFLVVANVGYAALGVYLAAWAMLKATPAVHQVQIRLGIPGLVAALFNKDRFETKVDADGELFEEKFIDVGLATKKVGIMRTGTGGSSFTVHPLTCRVEEENAMRRQYLESMVR